MSSILSRSQGDNAACWTDDMAPYVIGPNKGHSDIIIFDKMTLCGFYHWSCMPEFPLVRFLPWLS